MLKELLNRYMTDYQERAAITNSVAMVINAMIGAAKLILGLYLLSGWFIINALYYLILCAARRQALHKYAAAKRIEEPGQRYDMEFMVYQRSGAFLCLLGITYLLVCLRMYLAGDALFYRGYLVYLVATVAFTKLGLAIYGILSNRHLKGPIISTLRIISFTDAMVAIVVTQYTLLMMEHSDHALQSSALFGMGCSIVFFSTGIYMLLKKKKPAKAPFERKYSNE
ncbi:hypothetical protein [Paenibacillus sp. MMS20-IR301]|uniref:hypothetical protein n=1 Tax=Paenibacillus sp. MMS20-IR301 TaxID=2895946 RepID=UPI0028E54502|nr:hypothetical protein [Paenibacillus sp. MMS20-IR301]WNS43917.1 hypothetical protein LOS79_01235 [Paenibacillus sp. MMS20-IR301]